MLSAECVQGEWTAGLLPAALSEQVLHSIYAIAVRLSTERSRILW